MDDLHLPLAAGFAGAGGHRVGVDPHRQPPHHPPQAGRVGQVQRPGGPLRREQFIDLAGLLIRQPLTRVHQSAGGVAVDLTVVYGVQHPGHPVHEGGGGRDPVRAGVARDPQLQRGLVTDIAITLAQHVQTREGALFHRFGPGFAFTNGGEQIEGVGVIECGDALRRQAEQFHLPERVSR
jgi:hypothetical protein